MTEPISPRGVATDETDGAPVTHVNAFAQWLALNPLTARRARPSDEIDAIIDENRAAGA